MHHIGEQHGDLLVFGMTLGRCDRRTARITESGTVARFGAARAARCGHRQMIGIRRAGRTSIGHECVDDRLQLLELGVVERGQDIGRRIVDRVDLADHLAAGVGQ